MPDFIRAFDISSSIKVPFVIREVTAPICFQDHIEDIGAGEGFTVTAKEDLWDRI